MLCYGYDTYNFEGLIYDEYPHWMNNYFGYFCFKSSRIEFDIDCFNQKTQTCKIQVTNEKETRKNALPHETY